MESCKFWKILINMAKTFDFQKHFKERIKETMVFLKVLSNSIRNFYKKLSNSAAKFCLLALKINEYLKILRTSLD